MEKEFAAMPILPSVDFDDLLLLLPHELIGLAIVVGMLSVAIGRNHFVSTVISTAGMFAAGVAAAMQLYELAMGASTTMVTALFVIDALSALFITLLAFSAIGVAIMSFAYFHKLDDARDEFQLLLSLATLGSITLVSSAHFITVVIGLEMLSMALYGMIAYPIHSGAWAANSLESAIKYLALSAVASATMLFGMALIYAATGTLVFLEIAVATGPLFYIGLLMLFAGAAFKLSLVPFHLWTPDVYQGGPLPAVAFLATLGKVAVAVFVIRLFSQPQIGQIMAVSTVVALVAVASILVGNLLALRQTNLKRLLAYSSIAHMGYLLIAVLSISAPALSGGTVTSSLALESALFYLLVYSLLSLGAFGCAILVSSSETEAAGVEDYRGLFWRSPWLASALLVMVLGLAGIPLTAGFIAKFQVFFAAVSDSQWELLGALVIGSAVGLFYYLRVVYQMLMPVSETEKPFALREIGLESLGVPVVIAVLTLVVLWVGIYPEPLFALITAASF